MNLASVTQPLAMAKAASPELHRLKKVSNNLEAHFIKELLQEMKKSTGKKDTSSGFGEDTYNDMFDEEVSKSIQGSSHLGLANMAYKSMESRVFNQIRMQKASSATHSAKTTSGPGDKK